MELKPHCIIAEIPYPGLRKVAIKRLHGKWPHRNPKDNTVMNFTWCKTPEGMDFWHGIYKGEYDKRFEKPTLRRI